MASPYDVLDVDPDADDEEIERAYRRRVKQAHPDHGGSPEEFRSVREAYDEIVSDRPDSRADTGWPRRAGERREDVGDGRYWPGDLGRERDGEDGRNANGPGGRRTGEPGAGPRSAGDADRPTSSRVEYIDYEVLDDHGWDIDDDDLFEKASAADLGADDRGRILVKHDESLLEAAENRGFSWPFACRGGACANCAVAVTEGDLSMPVNHILPQELLDRGIRLSCVGAPTTDDTRVVYNVKHLPGLDELRLPPYRFERTQAGD